MLKNNIKKLICLMVAVLATVLCGCQYGDNADAPDETAADIDKVDAFTEKNVFEVPDLDDITLKNDVDVDDILSKQKIIFIMRSISYSEGYESRGYFVDNKGYRHYYDMTRYFLSKQDNNDDGQYGNTYEDRDNINETYDYLLEHFDDYEKEEFMALDDLKTCVKLLYSVDENSKVVTNGEPAIADYPGHEIYGAKMDNGNVNLIWLIDRGAYFNWLEDDCAKKIVDLFGDDWTKNSKPLSDDESSKWTEAWKEKQNMKKAEISGDGGTLIVYVPDNWECVGFPQTEENGTYSIRIKPDASLDGYISVSYEYQFGVCGTGLYEKEIQLAWDKAVAGYYDGSDKWSFIAFKGKNDRIVALNNTCGWFDDYEDEIMKILDYIDFDPNYFPDNEHKSFKQDNGIGISLVADDISPIGADLYFICNSEDAGHEYSYGDNYSLYVYNEEYKEFFSVFRNDISFKDIAYRINCGVASDFSINWEMACGKLTPGLYRLEKIVSDMNYDPTADGLRDFKLWVDFVIY